MAIRHFRKKLDVDHENQSDISSSDDSSSDESPINHQIQPHGTESIEKSSPSRQLHGDLRTSSRTLEGPRSSDLIRNQQQSEDEHEIETSNENEDSNDDTTDSTDSSDDATSEDEVVLHKPIFLKKSRGGSSITKLDTSRVQPASERSNKKERTLQRIEHEHRVIKDGEQHRQIGANYSSDKSQVILLMALDDNDEIDPQAEHEAWLERQRARELRLREKLEAKQAEFEEREDRILNSQGTHSSSTQPMKSGLQFKPQDRIKRQKIAGVKDEKKNQKTKTVFYQDDGNAVYGKIPQKQNSSGRTAKFSTKPRALDKLQISLRKDVGNSPNEDNEYSII